MYTPGVKPLNMNSDAMLQVVSKKFMGMASSIQEGIAVTTTTTTTMTPSRRRKEKTSVRFRNLHLQGIETPREMSRMSSCVSEEFGARVQGADHAISIALLVRQS